MPATSGVAVSKHHAPGRPSPDAVARALPPASAAAAKVSGIMAGGPPAASQAAWAPARKSTRPRSCTARTGSAPWAVGSTSGWPAPARAARSASARAGRSYTGLTTVPLLSS